MKNLIKAIKKWWANFTQDFDAKAVEEFVMQYHKNFKSAFERETNATGAAKMHEAAADALERTLLDTISQRPNGLLLIALKDTITNSWKANKNSLAVLGDILRMLETYYSDRPKELVILKQKLLNKIGG